MHAKFSDAFISFCASPKVFAKHDISIHRKNMVTTFAMTTSSKSSSVINFCVFWIFLIASYAIVIGGFMTLFLHLEKLIKKMLLRIFKFFPSGLRDATAPYFHLIEEHQCHRSVEKVIFEDPTLNFLHYCVCSQMHNMLFTIFR